MSDLYDDAPCPKCGGDVGHLINCPDGSAFSGDGKTMHPNTEYLMRWNDRMVKKFGQPETGVDWCRKLAYSVGEAGNDNPSNSAINIAKTWERMTPEEIENV